MAGALLGMLVPGRAGVEPERPPVAAVSPEPQDEPGWAVQLPGSCDGACFMLLCLTASSQDTGTPPILSTAPRETGTDLDFLIELLLGSLIVLCSDGSITC